MKCRRIGCTNNTGRGGAITVEVVDERRTNAGSGKYIGAKRAAEYKGHKEKWCVECVRTLEPHKYLLTYFVESRRTKLKRTKRAKIDKALIPHIPEPIAPIVGDLVETV